MEKLSKTMFLWISILFISFQIGSAVDVTGFETAPGGTNLVTVSAGQSTTLSLVYTDGSNPTLTASYDTGDSVAGGTVDTGAKTASLTIDSADNTKVPASFGTYLLTLSLTPDSGTKQDKQVVIFYEQAIAGFQVTVASNIVAIGEPFDFTVTLTSGSNIELEWFLDENSTCLEEYTGVFTTSARTHNFTTTGEHNITVVVANSVSRTYTNVIMYAYMRINESDFTITNNEGPIQTTETVTFTVALDSNIASPDYGNIYMEVNYNNGDVTNTSIASQLATMQGAGYTFTKALTIQGNYTVNIRFFADLNSVEYVNYVYVWDSVTVCLSSDLTNAKTGETVTFSFNSVPNSGFLYSVTLGDGSADLVNDESVLVAAYSTTTLTHVYNNPGVYLVTMAAWNPFYVSICDFSITVQVPIPTMSLTPSIDTIPLPDGLVEFTFAMVSSGPSPTNVTCDLDFDESQDNNKSVDLIFGNDIIEPYTFTSAAVKAINFTCWNLVSNVTHTASIDVKAWTLSDFAVTHLDKVSSNMTATFDEKGFPTPISESTEVTFNISLLGCSRPPPGVSFVWDFGDQTTTVSQSITNFDPITHTYATRGTYALTVDMTSTTPSATYSLTGQSVQIGIGVLLADAYTGAVGSSVTLTVSELVDTADSITIYSGDAADSSYPATNTLTATATHQYNAWGAFLPRALVITNGEKMLLYMNESYKADYALDDLSLEFSNFTVPLPPGILTVNVTVTGVDRPMVLCNVNSGDAIDKDWQPFEHNITTTSPMLINLTYLTLGEHLFQINCSNFIDTFNNASEVVARNPCFSYNGMFIRDYASPYSPMKAFTSVTTELANGMIVVCFWLNPGYLWVIMRWNNGDLVPVDYIDTLAVPPTGSLRFERGKLPPGIYKVCLNVTLEDTFAYECTYLGLVRPSPFPSIIGGASRTAKRGILVVDAYTGSYDQEGGEGHRDGLNYTFNCFRYNNTKEWVSSQFTSEGGIEFFTNDSSIKSNTMFDSANVCDGFVEVSPGKMQINATSYDYMSYLFILRVDLDQAEPSYFTQVMEVMEGDFPLANIECLLNCRTKLAVQLKTSLKCSCMDCTPEEVPDLTCSWSLQKILPDDSRQEVTDFVTMTETGVTDQAVVIKPEVLEAGVNYEIVLEMALPNRLQVGRTSKKLKMNLPPYGGSCYVTPLEGYAITGKFDATCLGWKDEGSEDVRDPIEDTKQVLTYEFVAIQQQTGGGESKYPITKGNAASANQMDLQVGNPDFDFNVTIAVYITDYYGDKVVNMDSVARVLRNESMVPSGPNDTGIISDLFSTFNQSRQQLEAGGNTLALVTAVGAMGSFISSIPVEEGGLVTEMLTEKNLELMNMLSEAVPNGTALSMSATDNLLSGVKTLLSNPDIVSDATVGTAINTAQKLAESLESKINEKPFPMEDVASMQSVSESLLDVVSSTSKSITPSSVVDQNTVITLESVREEMLSLWSYNTSQDSLTAEEQAEQDRLIQEEYDRRIAAQEETKTKAATAETGIPELFDIIERVQTLLAAMIQPGESEVVIQRDNCVITTEKTRLEDLMNTTTLNKTGFSIDVGNSSLDGFTEVQIDTSTFDDVVHFYGDNADGITSGEYTVSVKDENGTAMALNTTLNIKNKGAGVPFSNHMPMISDDGMTHIMFDLRYRDDAALIYILPKNFSFADVSSFNLYNVYVRCIDFAHVNVYDYKHVMNVRDWEDDYGFKIFVPQDTCDKGKTYVGLEPQADFLLPPQSSRMRRKRAAPTTTTVAPPFQVSTANFSTIIMTTGCRSWDKANNRWTSKGCTVLRFSTLNETICRCPESPGNTFSTTFYVPPNTIDFNTVWSKFDPANASVYGTVIGLLVVYIIACVFAHREDRKDYRRWATHFLCDSDSEDRYFYLITVHTGLRRGAGTKSLVNFVLAGEEMDTGVRIMSDGDKQGFETSSVRKFFMGTPEPLGDLTYLRIWHDSSGRGDNKSWYLHKVTVDDPQIGQRYVFLCDKWLAAEQDDGMVERLLPVCGRDNLLTFDKLFSQHARFNLTENHLWLSMVMRPEQSSFTRVQRLSCVLALLFLTMIANAMFFRSEDDNVSPNSVSIGFIRFSLTTVYVSFIGILITTPPILLVTYIYKKAKPTYPKNKKMSDKKEKEVRNIFQAKTIMNQNEHFSDSEFYSVDHLPLPSWSRYIATVIVILAVATSAFFLILYSMEWGKTKSEEWLTTFVFSFVESLLVVDPFKVIMIAVLFALLFKKPVDGGGPQLKMDKLRDAAKAFNAGSSRTYLSFRMDVLSSNSPPSSEMLEKTRIQRLNELKAREVFLQLVLYGIFAFVIYSISFVNRDQRSYNLKTNIYDSLVAPSKTHLGFSQVEDAIDFVKWINDTFFPRYFPETQYNGDPLDTRDSMFFWDQANARIGPPRLRQVRMKRGACPYDKVTPGRDCIPGYDFTSEEDNDYCVGWTTDIAGFGCTDPKLFSQEAWRYQRSEDIWGVAIAGNFDSYGGGGYILKFENGLSLSRLILDELQRYKWINRETRAVFLEFTLYNANTNLFAYVIFLAEFTELGGLVTWSNIYSFRAYQHTGALGTFAMLCYFIYIIVMIYGTVKLVLKFRKAGCCSFIKDVWNVVDTCCAILSFIGVVMWGLRYSFAKQSLGVYYDDKRAFINFQHVVIWDIVFNVITGTLVFIATIRILRILGYNKRMTQLAAVISNAAADLSGFGVVFGIVFFAYVSFGYLLFGIYIYEYRNLFTSFGSLANALIGKNSLDSMIRAVPNWSQMYYFTYVFFVILTLMTMFAVILNQSISEVRADLMKVPQTYGIMDILGNSVKDILGMAFKFKNKEAPEKENAARKYMPAVGKRPPEIDAPNILRLVRETFGETWDSAEQPPDEEEEMRRKKAEEQLLILDSYLHPKPGAKGGVGGKLNLHRPETPGDVHLTVETPVVDQDQLYSSYL